MTDLLEWATEQPLFTVNEAERATGMQRASLLEKLSRLTRRDDLIRIERGKYTTHDDPLLYATYIEPPSFISLWSGLRFYDLTTQQPTRVQVITADDREPLPTIEFFSSTQLFGFGKTRYSGFDIFVADEARLLLDCLSRKQVPVTALDALVERVDIETVTDYAMRLDRHSVKKRLGFLLERIRGVSVDALRVKDRNYPLLDLTRPAAGDTDARWRLRVNADVD